MADRTERFTTASLDGLTLCAAHWGDRRRPALVLLHGGGANHHWWDHLAPTLAEHFHVVALDFRGHGDSDYPEQLQVGAFHRDAAALVEHLGGGDVALVGHSLGAHVALHHAATRGASALAAIEPARGAERRERRRARLALTLRRTYATRDEAILRFRFVPPTPRAAEGLRRAIAEHSVRPEQGGRYGFKFDPRWFALPGSPPPPLERIRCPTLVLRGGESALLTREGAGALVEELPNARVAEIEGAGHNVHLEDPEAVLAALLRHLVS